MPRSPDDVYNPTQTVAPQTQSPNNYLGTQASPNAFGAQVGAATEKLGGTIGDVGQQVSNMALQYQQLDNETTANEAAQEYAKFTSNQEFEFHKQKGRDAAKALGPFQDNMKKQMDTMSSNIVSPAARVAFLNDARNFYDRSLYSAGIHAADEMDKAVVSGYKGNINALSDFSALHPNDVVGLNNNIIKTAKLAVSLAHIQYGENISKEEVSSIISENVGNLVNRTITSLGAQGVTLADKYKSSKAANQMFQQYKNMEIPGFPGVPIFDDKTLDKLTHDLNNNEYYLSARMDRQSEEGASNNRVLVSNAQANLSAMAEKGLTLPENMFPSEATINAAFPKTPAAAEQTKNYFNDLRTQSQNNMVLAGATPQQVKDLELKSRPDPNQPETFARQNTIYNGLRASLKARDRAIKTDPVGYLLENQQDFHMTASQGFDKNYNPTAGFGNFAQQSLAKQDTMGVPLVDQHLLPKIVAQGLTKNLLNNPDSAPAYIQNLKQKYGSFWPHVFRDMSTIGGLPPAYQSVAVLSEKDGVTLARTLAEKNNGKDIGATLPPFTNDEGRLGSASNAIRDHIIGNGEVTKFISNLKYSKAPPEQTKGVIDSIVDLAIGNTYYHNMQPKEAADAAIKSFTGDLEYLGGRAGVPHQYFDAVSYNAGDTLNKLDASNLRVPDKINVPGGPTMEEYTAALKANPFWVTNERADGVYLRDLADQKVLDIHGNPIEVKFGEPRRAILPTTFPTMIDTQGEGSISIQYDQKKIANKLATGDDQLRQQFGESMIRNYDYGRMKETNPIAYLGFLEGGTDKIHSFKTPVSALGMTFQNNDSLNPKAADYPLVKKLIDESGIDPKSIKGQILLGPEFSQGKNTNTLEHELMHRGLNYLQSIYPKLTQSQHNLIYAFQNYYGFDQHSHDLEANPLDMDQRQGLKSISTHDIQENKATIKTLASVWKDDFDHATELAKQEIKKRQGY